MAKTKKSVYAHDEAAPFCKVHQRHRASPKSKSPSDAMRILLRSAIRAGFSIPVALRDIRYAQVAYISSLLDDIGCTCWPSYYRYKCWKLQNISNQQSAAVAFYVNKQRLEQAEKRKKVLSKKRAERRGRKPASASSSSSEISSTVSRSPTPPMASAHPVLRTMATPPPANAQPADPFFYQHAPHFVAEDHLVLPPIDFRGRSTTPQDPFSHGDHQQEDPDDFRHRRQPQQLQLQPRSFRIAAPQLRVLQPMREAPEPSAVLASLANATASHDSAPSSPRALDSASFTGVVASAASLPLKKRLPEPPARCGRYCLPNKSRASAAHALDVRSFSSQRSYVQPGASSWDTTSFGVN